jgi:hypothetical protein
VSNFVSWILYSYLQTGEKLEAQLQVGQWGKVSPHTVLCCCWMPSGSLLTGSDDGSVVTWKNWKCVDKVAAHARGPVVQRPDGSNSFNGVRAIRLISNERYVSETLALMLGTNAPETTISCLVECCGQTQ